MTTPRRRTFFLTRRGALRAALSTFSALGASAAQARDTPAAGPVLDDLEGAEALAGVEIEVSKREPVLSGARRLLGDYRQIRRLRMGPQVEPAFSFRPAAATGGRGAAATPGAGLALSRPRDPRPTSEDLPFSSVVELSHLISRRKVSSEELTRLYLERLRRQDAALHCVVTFTEEIALRQARRADEEIARGDRRGPLHGVPWGVKDLFSTRGVRTTWGARPFADQVIDEDATVVTRLAGAGAVMVAKLSTGELAGNDLWFGGRTRNPWDTTQGSGGSSAGSAAATAAGLVGFSVGTDTGGSILQPAEKCGVVGLRPTYGRVSRHGVMPLRWTMDKVGPLCRSVEDCALVLNAIYGPDGRDLSVADAAFRWAPKAALSGLRIGFLEEDLRPPAVGERDGEGGSSRRQQCFSEALEVFRAKSDLQPARLPEYPLDAMWRVLSVESGAVFDEFLRSGEVRRLDGVGPNERAAQLRLSRFIPAVEYIQAQRARSLLLLDMERVFHDFDAILSPVDSRLLRISSMTGHPSVVLKSGFVAGMPVGLMITGRLNDEAGVLRAALYYEQATSWRSMHPRLG